MLWRALSPLWRQAALTWWRKARNDLTGRDPCHPDLPGIVLRIRDLECAWR